MALSLDDVVFGIYDAYKTTEDEQIKQGILKKRVHPDDFSASLKEQLKGLSDDELLSVSELLKEKLSNSNINDIVYAQNGVVNINIPQSMINQGIDNAKFRRRGVSGVSLENKPIAETIIETAGAISVAELFQKHIEPEDIIGILGGLNKDAAKRMVDNLNAAALAVKSGDIDINDPDATLDLLNGTFIGEFLDGENFKHLKTTVRKAIAINTPFIAKLLTKVSLRLDEGKQIDFDKFYGEIEKELNVTRADLIAAGFTENVIVNKLRDPEVREKYNSINPELQVIFDDSNVTKNTVQATFNYYHSILPTMDEDEIKSYINVEDIIDMERSCITINPETKAPHVNMEMLYARMNQNLARKNKDFADLLARREPSNIKVRTDNFNASFGDYTTMLNDAYSHKSQLEYSEPVNNLHPQKDMDYLKSSTPTPTIVDDFDDMLDGIDTFDLDSPQPTIPEKEAKPALDAIAEDLVVDRSFEEKSIPKETEPDLADDTKVPSTESFESIQEDDDSSTASSDSSTTSSNNTGMIVSEDKSAATVGGFWSNFMRHMREDKESKGFFGKIRSAFRKAREDRDKELGFAMDEPTEVSHSESPVEEPTFDDRYKVDMSGKSTPIAPQPEKSTTDTKQQNPEEPTQDTDEPLI